MPSRRDLENAYRRALLKAREIGHAQTRAALQRIETAFGDAARDIAKEEAAGLITPARAQALRSQLRSTINRLEGEIVATTESGVRTTLARITAAHADATLAIARRAGQDLAGVTGQFNAAAVRALAAITSRRGNASTFRTLVNRNMREAAPELDRLINSAVLRGVPTDRLTKDIAYLLAGGDPRIADVEEVDLGLYLLKDADVTGVKTLLSDARRIAVTETNNAMREANRQSLIANPMVLGCRWQRSGRHEAIGVYDECDALAEADAYGLGAGIYPPERFPLAPHPYCACTQGETIFRPVEQWTEPKGAPPDMSESVDFAPHRSGVDTERSSKVRSRAVRMIRQTSTATR